MSRSACIYRDQVIPNFQLGKENNLMEKLIKKLDELFEKYGVEEAEIAEVGELLDALNGELVTEGEEFEQPDMGEEEDGYEEESDEGYED